MGLRQRGSVIGNYVTASNTSASGMWTGKEAYTLQKKGTWQLPPTFSISAGAANVNEGASVNFTMTTTGVPNGAIIPYIASGANITILDSANSSLSGNFVIQNGSGTISFSANLDLTTEGSEVLQITAAGATANVTINDTSTTPVSLDAQFPYTTLLLNGQGTNNSQNNTFLDSSTNNFSITRNGNSTQGTFSPYGSNWSTSFSDSAGDYLEISSSTAFALGTGDFTIEAWIYPFSYGGSVAGSSIFGTVAGSGTGYTLNLGESQDRMRIISNASGTWADNMVVSAGGGAPLHTWSHIAWVRNGNSMTIYKNGTSVATMSGVSAYNFTSPGNKGFIGFWWDGGSIRYFNGYISNLRVVKGTALYTTTFTPSTTPLTAVANTQLLTCADNRFIDDSTNNFTITRYIAPKIQRFSPFSPSDVYSASTIGGSVYFDGTGDVLIGPTSNTVFQLTANGGTGLTVEAWIYPTNVTGSKLIASYYNYNDGDAEQGWYFRVIDGQLQAGNANGGTSRSGGSIPVNTWTHVAFVINSGSFYLYVNGVSVGSVTGVGTQNYSSTTLVIGGIKQNGSYTNQVFNGYISNLRTTNTAVYTGAFTPTTTPLTAVANTTMLCNFTNAGIIDNAMMVNLETLGDAKISTTQSKFGGSSMYFDGTGDYLYVPSNINNALGTGDFTLECWVNATSTPSDVGIFESRTDGLGATENGFTLTAFSSSVIRIYSNGVLISSTGTTYVGTWCHVAVVRSSGIWNLYINGVSQGTISASRNLTNTDAVIGAGRYGGTSTPNAFFPGYIDDLRITKGYARYTSTFTPPTNQLAGK
jgi:hypothetical protein